MTRFLAAVLLFSVELIVFVVAPLMVLRRWRDALRRALSSPPPGDGEDQAEQAM